MGGHRSHSGTLWGCVGITLALTMYAFVTGPPWTRPVFVVMVAVTALLAVRELRTAAWWRPHDAARRLLVATGRMPSGATAVTWLCREGSVIAVCSGPDGFVPARYFVDHDGAVFMLPPSCGSAHEFLERYPDASAREPFTIRMDRG